MSDLVLWDHSQPCEHGRHQSCDEYRAEFLPETKVKCPGGRKIVMRLIGNQKAGRVWVEVSDE